MKDIRPVTPDIVLRLARAAGLPPGSLDTAALARRLEEMLSGLDAASALQSSPFEPGER